MTRMKLYKIPYKKYGSRNWGYIHIPANVIENIVRETLFTKQFSNEIEKWVKSLINKNIE
ncbi:MAG: hypothetical protein ACE5KE_00245 [Methanosarcinales archaeon]